MSNCYTGTCTCMFSFDNISMIIVARWGCVHFCSNECVQFCSNPAPVPESNTHLELFLKPVITDVYCAYSDASVAY